MFWLIVVPAGIGLLAGLVATRAPVLVLASILTVAVGVAVMPTGLWPLWGIAYVAAMLCALQFTYLLGYLVACALTRLRAGAEQEASARERLDASYADWLWPSATDCSA